MKPTVAVTMGDAAGIGPEVLVAACAHPEVSAACLPVAVADVRVLQRAAALVPAAGELRVVGRLEDVRRQAGVLHCLHADLFAGGALPPFGTVSADSGRAARACVERAVSLAMSGAVHAVCTAPLHKEALRASGAPFAGHTELLAAVTGAPSVAMMLTAPGLRVAHVTTHVGLAEAAAAIEARRVLEVLRLGDAFLRRAGLAVPRIGVCGLNPHAGEHGLFGHGEEEAAIAPAVAAARGEGIAAQGPLPADTLFVRAVRGAFDLVVAMYHDQGHIPAKLLGFESGVNVTLGLPIVRTSPDHGTAFDIAGTGAADPGGMRSAILAAAAYGGQSRQR